MKNTSPAVNDYIERAQPFSRPILTHLRYLIHTACPEVEETIKWGRPAFLYRGKLLCGMAAFKQHCSFAFWNGEILNSHNEHFVRVGNSSMMQLKTIKHLHDLPDDKLMLEYLELAKNAIENPIERKQSKKQSNRLEIPVDFMELLKQNPLALATFEKFSYSHRKEYVTWITEAKKPETRMRRMEKALEMLAEGKDKNHAYRK
ncbi:MAG: YdeI/OmpD-associated family protein [Flavobacteriales bacterium]|nr:YdeI/OmpD-associated family protein [Flavobacteriales bacterium]